MRLHKKEEVAYPRDKAVKQQTEEGRSFAG